MMKTTTIPSDCNLEAGGVTRNSGQGTATAKDQDAVRKFRASPPACAPPHP